MSGGDKSFVYPDMMLVLLPRLVRQRSFGLDVTFKVFQVTDYDIRVLDFSVKLFVTT